MAAPATNQAIASGTQISSRKIRDAVNPARLLSPARNALKRMEKD
jgi:hypothetical protein